MSQSLRLALRTIGRACALGLFVSLLASPVRVFAAKPVDGDEYRLAIAHRVVSLKPRSNGKVAVELELTLSNAGDHALYDLRMFLTQVGSVSAAPRCEPARLRELGKGNDGSVTWVYECFSSSIPEIALEQIQFRVKRWTRRRRKS